MLACAIAAATLTQCAGHQWESVGGSLGRDGAKLGGEAPGGPTLPLDFDPAAYLHWNRRQLLREGLATPEGSKRHYLSRGWNEGAIHKNITLTLRYTACGGLFNQHYSHLQALALARMVGAHAVIWPPMQERESFAKKFSMKKHLNEQSWTYLDADTIWDFDGNARRIRDALGLTVIKHGPNCPLPDLAVAETAFQVCDTAPLAFDAVARVQHAVYQKARPPSYLVSAVKAAVRAAAARAKTHPSTMLVDLPCTLFMMDVRGVTLIEDAARQLRWAPRMVDLADKVMAGIAADRGASAATQTSRRRRALLRAAAPGARGGGADGGGRPIDGSTASSGGRRLAATAFRSAPFHADPTAAFQLGVAADVPEDVSSEQPSASVVAGFADGSRSRAEASADRRAPLIAAPPTAVASWLVVDDDTAHANFAAGPPPSDSHLTTPALVTIAQVDGAAAALTATQHDDAPSARVDAAPVARGSTSMRLPASHDWQPIDAHAAVYTQPPPPPAAYNGLHLRMEADARGWAQLTGGIVKFWALYKAAMQQAGLTEAPPRPLYVASGLLKSAKEDVESAKLMRMVTADVLEGKYASAIVYKEKYLTREDLDSLSNEQSALIDYLVLFASDKAVGIGVSTFSFYLAEARMMGGRDPRDTRLVSMSFIGTDKLLYSSAIAATQTRPRLRERGMLIDICRRKNGEPCFDKAQSAASGAAARRRSTYRRYRPSP